ncbi:MAG: hypothetical protein IT349_04420 [Candidatus Eisenbacteria bacterium]|nr:hypothetical protein [Candidatus Eisenbacteria bacterium]
MPRGPNWKVSVGSRRATALLGMVFSLVSGPHSMAGTNEWTPIAHPRADTAYLQQMDVTGQHLLVIACGTGGERWLFRRSHSGNGEWTEIPVPGDPIAMSVAGMLDEHLVVSTIQRRLWYSSNAGAGWVEITGGLPANGILNKVKVFATGRVYATIWNSDGSSGDEHGVAYSSDFGGTWGFSSWCNGCVYNAFHQLESNGDQNCMWTAGTNGWRNAYMKRTTDGGASWVDVQVLPLYGETPIDVVIDPVYSDNSYLLGPSGFMRFDGTEFEGLEFLPFSSTGCMSLEAPTWDPSVIYAAGRYHPSGLAAVVRADNFGYGNWEPLSEGIPGVPIPSPYSDSWKCHLKQHPGERKLYLEIFGLGLFERGLPLVPADSPVSGPSVLDDGIRMGAPTPNPTRSELQLVLEVVTPTDADLRVIDVRGRVVYSERSSWWEPGRHQLGGRLSPILGDLPSGAYLVQVRAGSSGSAITIHLVR